MYTGYIHKSFLKNYKKNELILYVASPSISNNPRIAVQAYRKLHVKIVLYRKVNGELVCEKHYLVIISNPSSPPPPLKKKKKPGKIMMILWFGIIKDLLNVKS